MFINFSSVLLTADGRTAEVIVPGIAQSWNDLAGCKKFEEFVGALTEECFVDADITVYGCDTGKAEIKGMSSLLIRISRDYRFVTEWCEELSHTRFKFAWSPSMQSGVDL